LERYPDTGSYASAGIARWLLDETDEAVKLWVEGLDCDYRDEAGGMELPLLLFYAAVRRPKAFRKSEAKKLIKEALKSSWATNWPGPLGRLVLKEIDESQTRELAKFDHPFVESQNVNELEFYCGVLALEAGDETEFDRRMQVCYETPGAEINNEWHIAHFEVLEKRKASPKT
jgi:hypothetical protein